MRMRLGFALAGALVGLTGCAMLPSRPVPVPAAVVCPGEVPVVIPDIPISPALLDDDGNLVCPTYAVLDSGTQAVHGYLACRAILRAWQAARAACVRELEGIE